MRSIFLKIYSRSIFYSLFMAVEAFVPFILAPLLTRILTTQAYGLWDLFIIFVTFMTPFVSLTIRDALKMRYYDLEECERARFLGTAFILSTLNAIVIGALIWSFQEPIGAALKFPAEWLLSIVITAYFFGLFYALLTYNQFANDKANYAFIHLVQTFCSVSFISILLIYGLSWHGVILGKIAGLSIAILTGILFFSKTLHKSSLLKPERKYFLELLKFGLFYLPAGIGIVSVGLIDRVIISQVYSVADVSFYGIAALFGKVLLLVAQSFILAWMPWLFQKLKTSHPFDKDVLLVSLSFMAMLPIGACCFYCITLFVAPILIGAEFHAAFSFIPWALGAACLEGLFFHNQSFLHFKQKIFMMSMVSGFAIISNIILTLIFITPYGIAGVFAATILSYILSFLLSGGLIMLIYKKRGESGQSLHSAIE